MKTPEKLQTLREMRDWLQYNRKEVTAKGAEAVARVGQSPHRLPAEEGRA